MFHIDKQNKWTSGYTWPNGVEFYSPDPKVNGNAGSFFKNPVVSAETANALLAQFPTAPHYPQVDGSVKLAAGWLIDQC